MNSRKFAASLKASLTSNGNENSSAKIIADKIRFNLHNSSAMQLLLIASISLFSSNAAAADFNWDGETSDVWTDGTNWALNLVPTSNDNVFINGNGATIQPIISGGTAVSNAFSYIGETSTDSGTVEVTGAGSTWTNNGRLAVGNNGTGNLTIANGGAVSNTFGIIGFYSTGDGMVEVTGADSTWTNSFELNIGHAGTGDLTITNGGTVSNTIGYIGRFSYSEGAVEVTGTGSIWTNSSTLYIGELGAGEFTITDGGTVSNTRGYIGHNSVGDGTVEIKGTGSTWTNSEALDIGRSGTGDLTITNGGAVSNTEAYIGTNSSGSGTVEVKGTGSTWANSSFLDIGSNGTGELTVTDGGSVSSEYSYVGRYSNGDGSVEIIGPDSSWTNNAFLEIGRSGTGKLTIASGGTVSNTAGNIGHNLGSDGTVEVTGTGSTWTNSSSLDVGDSGTGKLTIANGGTVSNTAGYIGHNSVGDGTVEVTGTDSTWTNAGNLFVSEHSNGKLTIADGGAVSNTIGYIGTSSSGDGTVEVTGTDSTWTNNSNLYVGNNGTGKLTIAMGGAVSNTRGEIGNNLDSDGTVEVTGTGSTWTNSSILIVGDNSTGKLTIAMGGAVSNSIGRIGNYSIYADGTVEVTGAGSTWTNGSTLYIGQSGTGDLRIADGGVVSNADGFIGYTDSGVGTVEVTGMGSTWTNSADLVVGDYGKAKLTVSDGGSVSNTEGSIGGNSNGDGTAEVTGTGSTWTNSAGLYVGDDSTGKLTVANGGSVSNTEGNIGAKSNGNGTVEVTGANSTWTNSAGLFVGRAGTGKMTVSDGGVVSNTDGYIGIDYFGDGTVEVTGTNSSWTNSSNLYVGYKGTAKLNVSNGGSVNVNGGAGNAFLGFLIGSNGTMNIGATPMDAAIAAGTLNASNVEFGEGIGTLNFNHTDANYQFAQGLSDGSGTSALNHYAGFTNLAGTINLSATPTTIYSGTLAIDQATSTFGAMSIRSGGILDLANNMNVGDAIAINGNFEALTGSTFSVDVNHLNQSDTLTVTGTVALGSELSVMARGAKANYVIPEYEYLIIDNDGTDAVAGTFSGVTTNYAFLDPSVEYDGGDGNDVILTLSSTAADFLPFATNTNQAQTAGAINDSDHTSPDGTEVFGAFIGLVDSQVSNVLDQVGGAALIAPTYLGGRANNSVMDQLNTLLSVGGVSNGDPLSVGQSALLGYGPIQDDLSKTDVFADVGYDSPSTTNHTAPNRLWTRVFGVRSQISSDGNSPTINSEQYGILLGREFAANSDQLMGLAAGYSRGTYATNTVGGVSNSDNFHIAGYGKFGASNPLSTGFGLAGTVSYTHQKFNTERVLSFAGLSRTATADYNATSYGSELRARFGFDMEGMIIAPFGELRYQKTQNKGFSETGAGILNLSAASTSVQHLTSNLGIEFVASTQHDGRPRRAAASIAWSHEFLDIGLTNQFTMGTSPSQFSIASPDEVRDSLKLGLGLDFALNETTLLELDVSANVSSTSTEYGASAAFKMRF